MSLILDALNRADNERKNQDTVPGLNTMHPAPAMVLEDKPENKQKLYIAISLSVVALVACVYWFIAKPKTTQVNKMPTAVVSVESISENGAVKSSPQAETVNVESNTLSDPKSPSLAEVRSPESVIAPKPTAVVEQLYAAPETKPASADPQVNQLYAAEEPAGSESIEDPFAQPAVAAQPSLITDTTSMRGAAEAPPARTFASLTNVQDFNELPWNTKQQIPTISYQRHNFLAGGVSTVVINGQTLGVGNIAASSQLVVQEIFEDGVVLKRGNVVFKLRALNGWINM